MLTLQPSHLKVVIIEDHRGFRETLIRLFRRNEWETVEVADGNEAYRYLHSGVNDVDVFVVDLALPGHSGVFVIDLIRMIGIKSPRTRLPVRVVACTSHIAEGMIADAIKAGADAIVLKTGDFDHLAKVCRDEDPGDVLINREERCPANVPTP